MVDQDGNQFEARRPTIEAQERTVGGRRAPASREPAPPSTRPFWRPRWQGVARLGLALGLVGFAAVVFQAVQERVDPVAPPVIDRLDPDAVIESTRVELVRTADGEENFVLTAPRQQTYENGSTRFFGGVSLTVTEQADRQSFIVTGTDLRMDGAETNFTISGDAQLTVSDGLVVRTGALVYTREQSLMTMEDGTAGPTTINRSGLEASGRNPVYDRDRAMFNLPEAAMARLTGDADRAAVTIESARATLAHADRYWHFEGGTRVVTGSMVLESENATAHFGEAETALERLDLRGNARIYPTESTSGELYELSASDMTLTFEETTRTLTRATLSGDASIHSTDPAPGGLRRMRAREMTVTFDETSGAVEQARLAGESTIELVGSAGGRGARISAATMDVIMAPDRGNVTALEAWDDVRLQLPNTPDGAQQEIRAGRLSPDGPPGAEMTAVRLEQNVEYRELGTATNTGAEMSRVIRAERLEARVEEGLSALVEARFLGDVLFEDGTTRRMLADEAVYDVLGGLVRLSAGGDAGRTVTLSDAGSDGDDTIDVIADVLTISLIRMVAPPLPVEAAPEPTPSAPEPTPPAEAAPEPAPIPESIEPAPVVPRAYAITLAGHEVSLDGSTLEASGNVTSVLTPRGDDTPESVSGKMPILLDDDREVLVSADAVRYDGNAGQVTYTGQAHLWQGATSFWGDTLTLDDRTGNLIARGNVRTSIQLVRLNETPQRREVSLTYAEADTFVYNEAAKRAVYETTARLRSEHVDLKADTIEVFLETDGRTLDKLQATGDVKLRLDGRWATGESLVYYEAEGRYEMEGAPVEIVEEVEPVETTTTAPPPPGAIPPPPSCRSSTGLTLTFYRSTDTVTVDGQEERRTEINSGKCTPLTF